MNLRTTQKGVLKSKLFGDVICEGSLPKAAPYSVYGTPGINYSEFYRNPPPTPKRENRKATSTKSGR